MVETKPYNRKRLPLMRDLKSRSRTEMALLERKVPILEWRKSRKKKGMVISTINQEKEQKLADGIAVHRANIKALHEEFKLVQMNKTESQYFQWVPNRGMNRKKAREFRKQRSKKERTPTNRVVK